MDFKVTDFGFEWGGLVVERTASDEKAGWLVLTLRTSKREVQVYATRTGQMRIWDKSAKGETHE